MTRPGEDRSTPFFESFRYAIAGVIGAYKEGHNIRVQTAAALLVIIFGFIFQIAAWEWVAVILCFGAVIGGEVANTAIEKAVDLASPDIHPLAKQAKDMAAGAVFVSSLASIAVGLIIFIPKIIALVG